MENVNNTNTSDILKNVADDAMKKAQSAQEAADMTVTPMFGNETQNPVFKNEVQQNDIQMKMPAVTPEMSQPSEAISSGAVAPINQDPIEGSDIDDSLLGGSIASDSTSTGNSIDDIIDDDLLKSTMPDLPPEEFNKAVADLKITLSDHLKNLVINLGLTPEEAREAVRNKAIRDSKIINNKYLEENPDRGVIKIDKTASTSDLGLTPEEHAKLSTVKDIQLTYVEDRELSTLKIAKVNRDKSGNYIRNIEGAICQYSVPLPVYGDFVSFKGAQIMQIASAYNSDQDEAAEVIAKKASLVYDRLIGGTLLTKVDGSNKTMSFEEFTSNFKFYDLEMAMFAILAASAVEETGCHLTCGACQHGFDMKFNIKATLDEDSIPEVYKSRMDTILGNKANSSKLTELHEEMDHALRFKSPVSQNIYELAQPNINKARNITEITDPKDQYMIMISGIAMFIQNMYIWDTNEQAYIQIEGSNSNDLMLALQRIMEDDITTLLKVIADKYSPLNPQFVINSVCPECGNKMKNSLNLYELVFLRARDSYTQIAR